MIRSIFLYLVISASALFAQKDPNYFLAKIPALPEKTCSTVPEQRSAYLEKVSGLNEEISEEISRRKEEADAKAENQEEQVKKNMADQYGLSDADMKKLQDKNLSESEKMQLVQKMMKASANNRPDQKKSMEMYKLADEQKKLTQKIAAQDKEFYKKLEDLNSTDTIATREYKKNSDPLFEELSQINDGEGSTEQDVIHSNNVLAKIQTLKENYCNKMTPVFYKIINDRLVQLKATMPDYRRLQELVSVQTKNTTGIQEDIAAPGLMELEAIQDYIVQLSDAYKYVK